ncbi:hypothetical protein PMKS-001745 [Pichia membranifaciens]|uniref:Cytochrome b-c1 complex subunit 6, mitochondrial n=1 Tax=Pichia membranifaciens TaxID=4926 RepID=A0A1Q2YFL3_9ASCO|nr:hypothetical protein PMKS-001745 [Pichia membranifaciens]
MPAEHPAPPGPTIRDKEPPPPVEEVSEPVEADAEEEDAEEDDDDEDDDDEDDDDDEEAEDQYDALKGECAELPSVKPLVHHYEECVERVTKEQEEPGYEEKHYKEDCVEEFFHLQHALTACAAPKLFSKLN